mmetsp:Transcript_7606/g.20051  ORF Transcript_7606/g.20051 Transcript_7606/m.20051 type:complete len:243 (-) Transcript_7606:343-1071(-)
MPSTLGRCIRGRGISPTEGSPNDVVREERLLVDPAPIRVRERRLFSQPRVAIDRPRVRLRQPRIRVAKDTRGRGGPVVGQRFSTEWYDLDRLPPAEIEATFQIANLGPVEIFLNTSWPAVGRVGAPRRHEIVERRRPTHAEKRVRCHQLDCVPIAAFNSLRRLAQRPEEARRHPDVVKTEARPIAESFATHEPSTHAFRTTVPREILRGEQRFYRAHMDVLRQPAGKHHRPIQGLRGSARDG